ncbi:MAG TPA: hypothetical protein VFE33_10985 [Thermoanaerobaculia bacterium]|nr:hypothetical protein [Thermoanaerobaculia bacterium]
MSQPVEKVIVAVHGIGDQKRFATIQQVLGQFSRYHGQAAAVPLGSFHSAESSGVFTTDELPELRGLGFAEVYWADVPRQVVKEEYVLEDVQPWVRTVTGRVRRRQLTDRALSAADERMIEQVLGEMLQTINVLERLFFLAGKMGLFSFDLKKVLVDFLDDVQVVAEFKQQGGKIGKIFADQMKAVDDQFKEAEEIYIVAHSEGTVVTLLGLLTALCSENHPWIQKVRGLMTLGSPIDKHLILWPELFAELKTPRVEMSRPIEWHNYYDYGDPVGFQLDTARERFTSGAWAGVFHFPDENDHGFARYPLPGKAHNDYWQDEEVFGHFIQEVIQPAPLETAARRYKPPRSKQLARAVSWVVPYLGAAALLFCAVFVLYKAVSGFIGNDDPILLIFNRVGRTTCLLAGLTVVARIPSLTRVKFWRLIGGLVFLVSIAGFRVIYCAGPEVSAFGQCVSTIPPLSQWGMLRFALGLLAAVYLVSQLIPKWSMRALLIPGAATVAVIVYLNIRNAHGNLWPVFVAVAAFLYLWWLVALLFDLTFVWHRYIRLSVPIFREEKEAAMRKRSRARGAVAGRPDLEARPEGTR